MSCFPSLVVALGFFVTASYSDCNWEKNAIAARRIAGCWKDDEMHPYFSKWITDDCKECTCHKKGMECCSHDSIAVGYNPKMCIAKKVNCTFTVVRRKDHSIPCPFKLLEIDSDSSDSSDDDSSDDDGGKIDIEEYVKLLSYFEDQVDCEENIEKKEEIEEEEEEENHFKPEKIYPIASY
ncbi:beta-microseminoprotein-like [Hyla sarda]|uniref:beta-microseminoprotein-like n=1 Tax=Hyla sarda TaxID=327740 RepID=UPI0024C44ABF|nr:beta-microseminoprotein-like [Hyla sarda]